MRKFKFKWLLLVSALVYAYYSFFYKSPETGMPFALLTILLSWFVLECYFEFLYKKRKLTFKFSERIIIGSSSILMMIGITGGNLGMLSRYHLVIFTSLWLGLLILSAVYLLHHVDVDPRSRVLKMFVEQMNQVSEFGLQRMHALYQAMVLTAPKFPIDNLVLTLYADLIQHDHLNFAIPSQKLEHFISHNVPQNQIIELLNHHKLENHFEGIQENIGKTLKDVLEDGTFEVTGVSPLYMMVVFAYTFNEILIVDRMGMDVFSYQVQSSENTSKKTPYHKSLQRKDAFGILRLLREKSID
ncbi:hypothetical protein [Erysipelothrix rhusiopathiae]|uniref:hypothetical protein n=1 Tax=Erysipelothrix rhusiopathiae TaxID=1648 RepID=UPI0023B1C7FF|nr:hypothetical protein [Erysipelothrix rhusiopathiae]MDE8260097.1 hypothetical protein [Erysipelothrix rhusiopathiae]